MHDSPSLQIEKEQDENRAEEQVEDLHEVSNPGDAVAEESGPACIVARALQHPDSKLEQRLFDPFYTTKPGGPGMGLAISRSIVRNQGGRLWAESNEGPGATFRFTVPKA